MNKKQYKIFARRVKWLTKDLDPNKPQDKEMIRYITEREEFRFFDRWRKKVKKLLPSIAQRVFELRSKIYEGCGFQYALEASLGRVISTLNIIPDANTLVDKIAMYDIIEINVHFLFAETKKAELSALDWLKKH